MKRSEFLKLTPEQIETFNATDDLENIGFSEEQWRLFTMLLGSYQGDGTEIFVEWIFSEMD